MSSQGKRLRKVQADPESDDDPLTNLLNINAAYETAPTTPPQVSGQPVVKKKKTTPVLGENMGKPRKKPDPWSKLAGEKENAGRNVRDAPLGRQPPAKSQPSKAAKDEEVTSRRKSERRKGPPQKPLMGDEEYGSAQEEEVEMEVIVSGHSGFVSRYVPPHSGEDEEHEEEEHTADEEDGEVQQDEEEEELNDLGAAELGEGEEEAGAKSQLEAVLSGPEQVVAGREKKTTSKVRRQSKDKGEKAWREAIRVVFKDVPYMIPDREDPDWERPWESPFIGRLLAEMSVQPDAKSAKLIRKLLRLWKHALREHGNKVRQRIRKHMLKNFNLLFGTDTDVPHTHHEKEAFARKFDWFIRGGNCGTEPFLGRSNPEGYKHLQSLVIAGFGSFVEGTRFVEYATPAMEAFTLQAAFLFITGERAPDCTAADQDFPGYNASMLRAYYGLKERIVNDRHKYRRVDEAVLRRQGQGKGRRSQHTPFVCPESERLPHLRQREG